MKLLRRIAFLLAILIVLNGAALASPVEALAVNLAPLQRYAVRDRVEMAFDLSISGGAAPYTAAIQITVDGSAVLEETRVYAAGGSQRYAHMPTDYGDYRITVTVTDAAGQAVTVSAKTPVSVDEWENASYWESLVDIPLSGDWRDDLIAIARTQVGYKESTRNFIIDRNGRKQGFTRYGAWYGAAYSEWCAMFVSFCLHYAGVSTDYFPKTASCTAMMEGLGEIFTTDPDYQPRPGDLVFLHWEDKEKSYHIGIIDQLGENSIDTIEGNLEKAVWYKSYSLNNPAILGYANMELAMKMAGKCICRAQGDVHADGCPLYAK